MNQDEVYLKAEFDNPDNARKGCELINAFMHQAEKLIADTEFENRLTAAVCITEDSPLALVREFALALNLDLSFRSCGILSDLFDFPIYFIAEDRFIGLSRVGHTLHLRLNESVYDDFLVGLCVLLRSHGAKSAGYARRSNMDIDYFDYVPTE